ncbi:MAG: metallophosphoesterase family protein [Evtepia gabavorous]
MLTFLHAADFHLDSPFHALPPEQAAERRQEQRQLLTRLADTARQAQVDLVFLAGDLFDGQRARPETVQAPLSGLGGAGGRGLLSPGNHDPYSPTSPYGKFPWPDHVHIFTQAAPARVEVPQLGAVVYGSAFTSLYRMDSPLAGFHAQEEDLAAFGCFHGDLSSAHSRYGPITHNEIAASGLHYLALGHSHSASGLKRAGKTYYAWPGCPEGRGCDETGDKGVLSGPAGGRPGVPGLCPPGPAAVPHPQPGHHRPGPCPGAGGAHPRLPAGGHPSDFPHRHPGPGQRAQSHCPHRPGLRLFLQRQSL